MPKKKIEFGDRVKVSRGEGVSIDFQGNVIKVYENSALIEIDESITPNPITILNLPNNFIVVRQSLCTAIDSNGKEIKAKRSKSTKAKTEKKDPLDEIFAQDSAGDEEE